MLDKDVFQRIAAGASVAMGSPWACTGALLTVLTWAFLGPIVGFSPAWHLWISSITTTITFTMVFVIQSSQNRDARALHLKLDELIRSTKQARNQLADIEHATEQELDELQEEFAQLRNNVTPDKLP